MQAGPQDGVAADALPAPSTPAVPTPPTKASVVATESTLLLMDMEIPLLEPRPCPAHGWVELGLRSTRRSHMSDPLGTLPAHGGLIRTERLTRSVLQFWRGKAPGQARKSRSGLNRTNTLNGSS